MNEIENLEGPDVEVLESVEENKVVSSKGKFFSFKNRELFLLMVSFIVPIACFFVAKIELHFAGKDSTRGAFSIVEVAKKSEGSYIDTEEVFSVTTKNGSMKELEEHLFIEPAVNYRIEEKSRNHYDVIAKDIPSDTIVNVSYLDNQVVEDKWAFQSTKDFKVSSIYPVDGSKILVLILLLRLYFLIQMLKVLRILL